MFRFTIRDVLWLGWWREQSQALMVAEELRLMKDVRRVLFPDTRLGEPSILIPGIRVEFEVTEDGTTITFNPAKNQD
jgi:hypothetical protein